MKRIKSRRGLFLVQTVVMVMLFAVIAGLVMELALGRATVVGKVSSQQLNRFTAKAAESKVLRCLEGTSVGASTCAPGSASACFPTEVNGQKVTVTISGTAPACAINISVQDPA
ncbi:MAG TPA: hypothetical protein VNI01_04590 [Elusimicrobiota bacterium]|nr:hypothetical protein [Elusimicrobiota bacterium]